ncbi:PPC domain-containing DNA-binding protein [Halanaerobaculum tunisiense]
MLVKDYEVNKVYQGRLETGDDLLTELTELIKKEEIKAGKVSAIGAVKEATLSYYDQVTQEYQEEYFEEALEIVNLSGNISLKDGQPIIHAHISLGNEEGKLYGGHLAKGTTVFACEFAIEEYKGEEFNRGLHQETGLPLWKG